MKKSIAITIQVTVLLVIALAGIVYIMNRTPVEDLGEYEKQEMVRPNKTKSIVDGFFKDSDDTPSYADEDNSFTGADGRYDEVRIGGKAPE